MAKTNVRGITLEIGGDASGLVKTLDEVTKDAKSTGDQLKDVNKLLKLDPSNTELLAQKQVLLAKNIEECNSKLKTLNEIQAQMDADGVEKTSEQYMALGREIESTKLYAKNAETELDEMNSTMDGTDASGTKAINALSKVGGALGTVATVAGTAVLAVGAGLVKIGKESVEAFAEYEQLVGGVDTLFKESSATVQEYAQNAYKTAGLSANEYMETVMSFSASLLKGLNGDTAESAKIADMAITDMADNANKFGTDISSVQNAYQGFAKQNYTMLENLSLGYAGTKSGMESLLADAEKLTGIHYDIDNLSDVYSAIHAIQTEMGVAGTTAKEASTTIQGSISSMKSAWQNFITGLAAEDADYESLAQNLVDSVLTVVDNIAPVVERIAQAIPQVVEQLAPMLETVALPLLTQLAEGIAQNLPALLGSAGEIVGVLVEGIVTNIPQLLYAITQILLNISWGIISGLGQLLEPAKQIVAKIGEGISNAVSTLLTKAGEIIETIKSGITNKISEVVTIGSNVVKGIWEGISNSMSWIMGKLRTWVSSVLSYIKGLFGIHSPSKITAGYGKMLVQGLAEGITDNTKLATNAWDKLGTSMSFAGEQSAGVSNNYSYGGATVNVYPQSLNEAQVDYLFNKFNSRLVTA